MDFNGDIYPVSLYFGAVLGSVNWDLNSDMNLDGKIDIRDLGIIVKRYGYGTAIPINTTPFTTILSPGTYKLRAKYGAEIKNNESVVINAGQKIIVNFNFLPCQDAFSSAGCVSGMGGFTGCNNACSGSPLSCSRDYSLYPDCAPTNCCCFCA